MQVPTNSFEQNLVSLSVADLLVRAVVQPIFLVEYLTQSVDNQNVIHFFWIHSTAATTWNLCCVSVDRFAAIRFPLSYQVILTKKRCCVVITVIWVISLFLPFTIMFVKNEAADHHAELWLSFAFILFVFPIIVVFFCYICIFKTANKQYKRVKKDYQWQLTTGFKQFQSYQNSWTCFGCFYRYMDAIFNLGSCHLLLP